MVADAFQFSDEQKRFQSAMNVGCVFLQIRCNRLKILCGKSIEEMLHNS